MYDYSSEEWRRVDDYPFFEDISLAPVVSYDAGFIVFGGYAHSKGQLTETGVIAMFSQDKWRQLGTLKQEKRGHGVIIRDNIFWVIGGTAKATSRQDTTTETCIYDGDIMTCKTYAALPLSSGYSFYPELFLIDDDLC